MNRDDFPEPSVDPIKVGFSGRCPRCGEGRLFNGVLSLQPGCRACGLDFDFADSGDGPAVFGILIVGFVIIGLALWMRVSLAAPIWLILLLLAPSTIILSLLALRWGKGILIALQYRNNARQGEIHRD